MRARITQSETLPGNWDLDAVHKHILAQYPTADAVTVARRAGPPDVHGKPRWTWVIEVHLPDELWSAEGRTRVPR